MFSIHRLQVFMLISITGFWKQLHVSQILDALHPLNGNSPHTHIRSCHGALEDERFFLNMHTTPQTNICDTFILRHPFDMIFISLDPIANELLMVCQGVFSLMHIRASYWPGQTWNSPPKTFCLTGILLSIPSPKRSPSRTPTPCLCLWWSPFPAHRLDVDLNTSGILFATKPFVSYFAGGFELADDMMVK